MNSQDSQTPDQLWAPWRMSYIKSHPDAIKKDAASKDAKAAPPKPKAGCFMCEAGTVTADPKANQYDEQAIQRLVLLNDERGVLMLNRYPYTNGHLMVFGHDHIGDLVDHSEQQRNGLMSLTALAEEVLQAAINPQGFNIGINVGRAGGAGVPGHMHIHIVPRWQGDVNFMTTVSHARVVPQALEESYEVLRKTIVALMA